MAVIGNMRPPPAGLGTSHNGTLGPSFTAGLGPNFTGGLGASVPTSDMLGDIYEFNNTEDEISDNELLSEDHITLQKVNSHQIIFYHFPP